MVGASYSRHQLGEALAKTGLRVGDTVFSHVSLVALGVPPAEMKGSPAKWGSPGRSDQELCDLGRNP